MNYAEIDTYLNDLLLGPEPSLSAETSELPQIAVAPNQGKLLYLLARMTAARRILEIGTLAGYSTIWLGRALPHDGTLVSLEADPHHAEVARGNIDLAGLSSRVSVLLGPALRTLPTLHGPFDLVFLDADKTGYPAYLEQIMRLSRAGTVIVADNVVRDGLVADPATSDASALGVRRFLELAAADSRLEATALQTVGAKGHDGFALLRVR